MLRNDSVLSVTFNITDLDITSYVNKDKNTSAFYCARHAESMIGTNPSGCAYRYLSNNSNNISRYLANRYDNNYDKYRPKNYLNVQPKQIKDDKKKFHIFYH